MFSTADYYLGSETAFRRERTARDWSIVNGRRRRRREARRRNLRLPKQPTLRLPGQRRGGTVVA